MIACVLTSNIHVLIDEIKTWINQRTQSKKIAYFLKDIPADPPIFDSTLDDDLRSFEDLLSLLPPTDPLDSQLSTSTQPSISSPTTALLQRRPQHDPSLYHDFTQLQLSQ